MLFLFRMLYYSNRKETRMEGSGKSQENTTGTWSREEWVGMEQLEGTRHRTCLMERAYLWSALLICRLRQTTDMDTGHRRGEEASLTNSFCKECGKSAQRRRTGPGLLGEARHSWSSSHSQAHSGSDPSLSTPSISLSLCLSPSF